MEKIVLTHLPVLLILAAILLVGTAILSVWTVTQTASLMQPTTPGSQIEDIVTRYQNDQLSELDDLTLAKAADQLEYAHKHYFDQVALSQLPLSEFYLAQVQQRELRQIADTIWRLLQTRYGCND